MADETLDSIDPSATYTVRLTRPVKLGLIPLNAGRSVHEMPGESLLQIIAENGTDAVRSAVRLG
ncbi:hypothetical protein [Bosea sp. TAB14]|uniref:hypothetical protein n=1 Tax=Bosea sp. TAB14 TaxID=3237481 RepID=UPI003F8EF193